MHALLRRVGGAFASPGALASALLGAMLFAAQPDGSGRQGLVVGWLYGALVAALVRRAPLRRGAYCLAGLLVGPLPFALLLPADAPSEDRGLIWAGALAGLVIGLAESLGARRAVAPADGPEGARETR